MNKLGLEIAGVFLLVGSVTWQTAYTFPTLKSSETNRGQLPARGEGGLAPSASL